MTVDAMSIDESEDLRRTRAVADAVLYEGYLLYPYRATSSKNQVRWQFGVLGPPGAQQAGVGEDSRLSVQCLVQFESVGTTAPLSLRLRFLQLQHRVTEALTDDGLRPVAELTVDDRRWFSWDEAVEVEHLRTVDVADLLDGVSWPVVAAAGTDHEPIHDRTGTLAGELVRRRWEVRASISARLDPVDGLHRLTVTVDNTSTLDRPTGEDCVRHSLLGAHLILHWPGAEAGFVSVIDPPEAALQAAGQCQQHRCWPVLAGRPGSTATVLASPIILYDYPEIAGESTGSLFDATEIDEILTLRVLTMTDAEKQEARATDPKAAEIIDRCEALSPTELARLHGTRRDPWEAMNRADPADPVPTEDPFAIFNDHDPDTGEVIIAGVPIRKGSLVRLRPQRRADAQDLFYADQIARVEAVHRDLDDETHLAVVLVDDPAADLHSWYGRYLYFSPDEVVPVQAADKQQGQFEASAEQQKGR